jgi:glycosyl-4,4'-diaponeurosporenoate acyltransferase
VIELPPAAGVALNVVVWAIWSLAIGFVGHRRPPLSFASDRWWSRLRNFERSGSWYARVLLIKRWKDLLPELGSLFSGGFAKRTVYRDRAHLERFIIETRRAEWVHWMVFLLWPAFAIWNPPWAVVVIAGYATAANLPCLLVQRYNRARLLQTRKRFARRNRTSGT